MRGPVRFEEGRARRCAPVRQRSARTIPISMELQWLDNRLTGSLRLSAYGIFSLKAGLTSDSGFHCSPYKDL